MAFLVTAANVAEVTVGLKVVDRVKVPRPQGRPRQCPVSRPLRRATTAPTSGGSFAGAGFSRPFPGGSGKTAAAGQAGASNQPELMEGRAEPQVVRQLEEIGHQV